MTESCGLADKKCVPCSGGTPRLTAEQIAPLIKQLDKWDAINNHHLHKNYTFPDFKTALAFVNAVGDVAEAEGHHPDINFTWGKADITIYTHAIDGLSESDFILAAKIDKIK
ncbi:MAG: 4a-hydroxytetrahydrobiopterin dehydratase [Pyrinomonadaceae bacterium]